MRPLRKLFQYVWPQWPRIIAAVTTALLVGLLQSLSIATISPLIQVMMKDGGLHRWVDEKVCKYQYGMQVREVDTNGFVQLGFIDPNSLADLAGLRSSDIITAAHAPLSVPDPNLGILGLLATSPAPELTVTVRRLVGSTYLQDESLTFPPPSLLKRMPMPSPIPFITVTDKTPPSVGGRQRSKTWWPSCPGGKPPKPRCAASSSSLGFRSPSPSCGALPNFSRSTCRKRS